MAETARENLRDFQARLAERLKVAETRGTIHPKLGFLAGGHHWMVNLDQVNEVVTVPLLTQAPWARPWFVGVASVRGVIYGCVDLAAYAGVAEPLPRGESRLLLAHPRFGMNVALRVERALGLRPEQDLVPEPPPADSPTWMLRHWRDSTGVVWTEISVEDLVRTPHFLEAGA
ncbi:MAG TPA: chemotaxis protein CheW [Thiobacillaceae bacterium]|nr:chemotaxis protein CheW [Thiobacillaceae bacterium]HNU64898.1 chemotaxis protein CheW [Thiobacillaceae bacterium]